MPRSPKEGKRMNEYQPRFLAYAKYIGKEPEKCNMAQYMEWISCFARRYKEEHNGYVDGDGFTKYLWSLSDEVKE